MSFGDLEYQETSSQFLTRLLKSMKQEQIILDAVQNPIDDVEEYPDSRLVQSIIGTKDSMGAVSRPTTGVTYTLPAEPSYKTRLWLWFREGWRLKDHSLFANNAFMLTKEPFTLSALDNYVPFRRKVRDDGITDGREYRITNGLNQYCRVEASQNTRISDLLQTETDLTFSIFFTPFGNYTVNPLDPPWASIFQALDDDQITHGIKVNVDVMTGAVRFGLIYQSNAYEVITPAGAAPVTQLPEFLPGEFLPGEFLSEYLNPIQQDPNMTPTDWTWLFFHFNKGTRKLKITKVADGGYTSTVLVQSPIDETGLRTTFGLYIPGNEGGADATTAYDTTNNNNDAVFGTSPTNNPTFITGGGIRFDSNTETATIANHSSIDALSVFTIAFKLKLYAYSPDAFLRALLSKNINASTVAGSFVFLMNASGSNTLSVNLRNNANTFRSIAATAGIASLGVWYDVILTYDGSNYNLQVGAINAAPTAGVGDVITSANPVKLGATLSNGISAANCEISHVVIDKGTAWGASQKAWFASLTPGFKAGFPAWKPPKPPEPAEPLPVVRPMQKLYELIVPDDITTQKVNAPSSATPFVSEYNVPGGTASTTPEELKYDVADGTTSGGSTNPYATVYSLAPQSSTGTLTSNEVAYGQQIMNGNSNLEAIKPTRLTVYLNKGNASGGTVYLGIIKQNGSTIKFGTGISVSNIPTDWTQYQRTGNQTSGSQYTTVVGDAVGVIWEGGSSGTLNIQRGGANNHSAGEDGVDSQQGVYNGTSWSNNATYSMAGTVETGGETVAGTNPYYQMDLTNYVVANYQNNSTLENIAPTKIIWRARRKGSAVSARVVCRIRNTSSALLFEYPQIFNFNDISTTTQDLLFTDTNNSIQWQDGYRLCLEFSVLTGINDSTNVLEVNYNIGPSNTGMVGGTSIKAQYYRGNVLTGFDDVSPAGTDWAGKIYIGGAAFTSYKVLDHLVTRIGEKVAQYASPNISKLFNKKLTKWNAILKKEGNPTGSIRIKCYNGSTLGEAAVFTTIIDASSLTTTDTVYTFQHLLNNFAMDGNSRIVVHYENGTAADKVLVKINKDATVGAAADGVKSILTSWNGTAWVDESLLDVSGEIFTGGVPDLNSRPKVAIRNDSEFGLLMQKKVTKVEIKLKKLGAPTGTYYIRTVRGSDGSNRDLIGSGDIALLSTTAWTLVSKDNFNAIHYMGVTDKVVVEYEGGTLDNCLLVQVKKDSTYDGEDSIYEEFDAINWNKPHITWDIAATVWTGGDTYTPDPGTPYVEPPDYYEHDMLVGAGHSGWLAGQVDNFYGMRQRDFRVFTESLTLEEIQTMYDNKWSKRGTSGSLALIGWFTLNAQTTE